VFEQWLVGDHVLQIELGIYGRRLCVVQVVELQCSDISGRRELKGLQV